MQELGAIVRGVSPNSKIIGYRTCDSYRRSQIDQIITDKNLVVRPKGDALIILRKALQ